jgi:hypothetical protein
MRGQVCVCLWDTHFVRPDRFRGKKKRVPLPGRRGAPSQKPARKIKLRAAIEPPRGFVINPRWERPRGSASLKRWMFHPPIAEPRSSRQPLPSLCGAKPAIESLSRPTQTCLAIARNLLLRDLMTAIASAAISTNGYNACNTVTTCSASH